MKVEIKRSERINGEIKISGSKNTALPIICASLLTNKKVILENIPMIDDIYNLIEIIKIIGCKVKQKNNQLIIKAHKLTPLILSKKVQLLRGSYYLIGVCLARHNKCVTYMPGGCNLGERPIDYHLSGFKQLGYKILMHDKIIKVEKEEDGVNVINLPNKSVGATINMLLASFRRKQTIINNVSTEPEVQEVITFLRLLGCNIQISNNSIIINGTKENQKIKFKIVGDRIEAGSYMLLAASIPNSKLTLKDVPIKYMQNIIDTVKEIGSKISINNNTIVLESSNVIKPLDIIIKEYPAFPTDLQQILTTVLTLSKEQSIIEDLIYPKRISHVAELNKLNAKIKVNNNKIIINHSKLVSNEVIAKDLRCGFALIVAGCICDEKIIVDNFEIIHRGYEKVIDKLRVIGVDIKENNL